MNKSSISQKSHNMILKMFKKIGSTNESIHFSDHVVKINRKKKSQIRFLLITDVAIYNILPSDLSKCRRRILIEKIGSISMSKLSDEFVIHVFDEYDYRYKSNKKREIKDVLADLYYRKTNRNLIVKYKMLNNLHELVLTKKESRLQTREEKLKRREQFLELDENDSDKEEAENKISAVNMLDSAEEIGIDDFELLKVIGRGSFGKVLQVRKKSDRKIYAMKILKKSGVINKNQIEHTNAERRILQIMQHPFLMKLRFAFQTSQKLYIVIDFYKGGELFFHLKKKTRFSESEARFIIAETILALGHLHKNGIIYRDLKPENILLDETGHICLTDFGLSKILDSEGEEEAYTFCGTPEYLAPEIIKRVAYTKSVDWWSLGVLLYELTVGKPPFYSRDVNEMYQMIQTDTPAYPNYLSKNCISLLKQLLVRDSSRRLGSGSEGCSEIMSHEFFTLVNWDKLLEKQIAPLYKPKVKKKETDTTNFDNEFTNEPVADSAVPEVSVNDDFFKDFAYKGSSM